MKKNITRELINSSVFNSGQARLAMINAPFLKTFLSAAKIRPHSQPSRIRGTSRVNKRPNGLICNKAALKAEPPVRAIMALAAADGTGCWTKDNGTYSYRHC